VKEPTKANQAQPQKSEILLHRGKQDSHTIMDVTVHIPSFDLLEQKVHGSQSSLEMQNENGEALMSSIPLGFCLEVQAKD
jgi:hypothetical protein